MAVPLKTAMRIAAFRTIGREVAVSNNFQGLDEVQRNSPELEDDYVSLRALPRRHAYEVRQRIFQERVAYLDAGV